MGAEHSALKRNCCLRYGQGPRVPGNRYSSEYFGVWDCCLDERDGTGKFADMFLASCGFMPTRPLGTTAAARNKLLAASSVG